MVGCVCGCVGWTYRGWFCCVWVYCVGAFVHDDLLWPDLPHMKHLLGNPFLPIVVVSFLSSASLFFILFGLTGAPLVGGGNMSGYGVSSHNFSPLVGYMSHL